MVNIRTLRGQVRQRDFAVPLHVIDHDLQVIFINIHGVNERVNNRPAEKRIIPVAGGEAVKEEEDAVAVHELALGIAEGFNGRAEGFRGVLQGLEADGGRGVPDPFRDGVVYIVNLFCDFIVLRHHRGERGRFHLLALQVHDGVGDAADLIIGKNMVQDEGDHGLLQVILRDGFFRAGLVMLAVIA